MSLGVKGPEEKNYEVNMLNLYLTVVGKRFVKTHCGKERNIKVPIKANWKGVCLQNTSKPHSYHLNPLPDDKF